MWKTGRNSWYSRELCYHSEGPQQIGENGWQESHEVHWREMQRRAARKGLPHILVQAASCLESRLRRTSASWWTSWTGASNASSQQWRPIASWAALGKALPAGCRSWTFPSIQPFWEHFWSAKSLLDSSGKTYKLEKVQPWSWRDWNMYFMRKCWEISGSSAWIREDSGWMQTENSWKVKARTFPLLEG